MKFISHLAFVALLSSQAPSAFSAADEARNDYSQTSSTRMQQLRHTFEALSLVYTDEDLKKTETMQTLCDSAGIAPPKSDRELEAMAGSSGDGGDPGLAAAIAASLTAPATASAVPTSTGAGWTAAMAADPQATAETDGVRAPMPSRVEQLLPAAAPKATPSYAGGDEEGDSLGPLRVALYEKGIPFTEEDLENPWIRGTLYLKAGIPNPDTQIEEDELERALKSGVLAAQIAQLDFSNLLGTNCGAGFGAVADPSTGAGLSSIHSPTLVAAAAPAPAPAVAHSNGTDEPAHATAQATATGEETDAEVQRRARAAERAAKIEKLLKKRQEQNSDKKDEGTS